MNQLHVHAPGGISALTKYLKSFSRPHTRPFFSIQWMPLVMAMVLIAMTLPASAADAHLRTGDTVLRATLQNGLEVVIVRNPLAPVVTTVVNYKVGSNESPAGFPGMAHAQEHMMFRGNPGLSADQLADIVAAMGGDFDADTQQTVTQYFFTVPAQDLDTALRIESIRMRGVTDSEKLWKKERGAIEQEVARDLSSPEYVFYTRLLHAMFKGTVYAHDALGTRPSFNRTTGAMLKKFYDAWYAPNNAILVIAGDVRPKAALATVKKLFEDIPARPVAGRPVIRLSPVKSETFHHTTDLPYGMAVVAYRMPGTADPDYAAARILADVLDSQRGDLYGLVPQGKALDAGFSFAPLPRSGLGYATATFPAGGNGKALLGSVKRLMARTLKNGVPADLVAAAKRRERASAAFQKNSVSGLAMAWSNALAVEGRTSPNDDIAAMEKVTVADVNRVAKKYLDPDHAIFAILTPQPSGRPIVSKGFGGKESFAPSRTKGVKLPEWAQKAVRRLSVPASTVHPVEKMLSNGIRLIVQPESVSRTISVYGRIKTNPYLQIPKGQEGVDDVLGQLFSFGTTTQDRLAFQKALDDIAADESAGTDFSLRVVSDHFDRGVQLLAANELSPALPEQAFTIIQKQTAASLAGEIKSPDYRFGRAIDSALVPPGDPTLRRATPASVMSLTPADVRHYYKAVFRPDMTTIVVIGNVTPEAADKVITKYFGHWKATGPKPDTDLPPIPGNKPSVTRVPDTSRVQDKVILASTVGLNRTNPDYYALQLGNHVLGGAFYATRLYRDLREETGLVYNVSSAFEIGKTRGFYTVEYGCDPDNVSRARAIIVRDLKAMQTQPVSADELRQAKALMLREIPLSESSMGDIAGGLLHRALHDLPLDEPTRAARRYVRTDANQVMAAYAKWLRPDDLIQVSEGPMKQ